MSAESFTASPTEPILPDESMLTLSERYQCTRIGEVPERWAIDKPNAPVIEIEHLRTIKPDAEHALRFVASFGLSPEQSDIFTLLMHATEEQPLNHDRITSHILSPDRSKWNEYDCRVVSGQIMQVIDVISRITRSPDAVIHHDTWQDGKYDHPYYLNPHLQIIDKRAKEEVPVPVSPTPIDVPRPHPRLEVVTETPPEAPTPTPAEPKALQPTRFWLEPSTPPPTRRRLSLASEPVASPSGQKRVPLQVVQESLTQAERAAVYTAHCMGRLITDRMIKAGLHIPEQVYAACGVEDRAQLIKYVQNTIMPQVREIIASEESIGLSKEGFAAILEALHNQGQ